MNKALIEEILTTTEIAFTVNEINHPVEHLFKAYMDAGIHDFGESRVSAFLEKEEALENEPITWHFLGTLQSKKVKKMIEKIDCLHSLDRLSVAKEIEKRRTKPLECLIQVNISGEESKHGVEPGEVSNFVETLNPYEKINVIGLMGIAKRTDDETVIREQFRSLRHLRDATVKHHPSCKELSMGMSEDYQIAIEEGATMLRLGRILIKEGLL